MTLEFGGDIDYVDVGVGVVVDDVNHEVYMRGMWMELRGNERGRCIYITLYVLGSLHFV